MQPTTPEMIMWNARTVAILWLWKFLLEHSNLPLDVVCFFSGSKLHPSDLVFQLKHYSLCVWRSLRHAEGGIRSNNCNAFRRHPGDSVRVGEYRCECCWVIRYPPLCNTSGRRCVRAVPLRHNCSGLELWLDCGILGQTHGLFKSLFLTCLALLLRFFRLFFLSRTRSKHRSRSFKKLAAVRHERRLSRIAREHNQQDPGANVTVGILKHFYLHKCIRFCCHCTYYHHWVNNIQKYSQRFKRNTTKVEGKKRNSRWGKWALYYGS